MINHKTLLHPNIIRFKEVFVTSTHLGIVMEYAAGGELFDRIVKAGRFSEDEARYFFQQLISGVEFCHSQVLRVLYLILSCQPVQLLLFLFSSFRISKEALMHQSLLYP